MTEPATAEPVVISAETPSTAEKIVERKTIVFETRIDPTVIRVTGEKLKEQLFTKLAFYWFQTKSKDIHLVSIDKYYEPYIVISGKYFLDYYRKSTYRFKVDTGVKEVVLLKANKLVPETSKSNKIVKLQGEERLINEAKAFLILDKNGRDSEGDNMPPAPSEKNSETAIKEYGIEELAENVDVDFLKERIAQRPKDIARIVEEKFEIFTRAVVYIPRFKLLYRNVKTGEEKILVLDGVTGKKI